MFEARLMEIASAGGQAAGHSLGAAINPQFTVEQRHNNIFLLVPVPSNAIPGLREMPSCYEHPIILDLYTYLYT